MRFTNIAAGLMAILGTSAAVIAQCEPQTLEPLGMPRGGSFGSSLLIQDGLFFVGNPGEPTFCPDPFDCGTGALHVFGLDGDGLWQRTQHIVPPDITVGSGFGISFSRDGDRLLVGAASGTVDGERSGKAYLYEFDGEQWNEIFQFRPDEPRYLQGFGSPVALHGGAAVLHQDEDTGSLLLFEELAQGWELIDEVVSPVPASAGFGETLAMKQGWVFAGSPGARSLHGSVYAYRRVPGTGLEFRQRIDPPDLSGSPEFGGTLSFDGETLAVGGFRADRDFLDQGVVYVYSMVGGRWELAQELTHSQPAQSHGFGVHVHVSGDTLIAGSLRESPRSYDGAGYVFRRGVDGAWSQTARIDAQGRMGGFGHFVATNGSQAAIGTRSAFLGGFSVGLVHAYDLDCLICEADLDLDGSLTIFDFLVFANLFQDGRSEADFDGDGELTLFDFLAFQTAFDAGC